MGEWHPWSWRTWRLSFANVCPELKILFAGEGTWSFGSKPTSLSANFCPQTQDPFPNFLWRKGIVLALKVLANHLTLSSTSISSGHATSVTYIPFSVHGVQVALAFILTWIRLVLGTCWFKHRRVGELTPLSPSVAYHITILSALVEISLNKCSIIAQI